jgi:ferredoxin-NADP reductase
MKYILASTQQLTDSTNLLTFEPKGNQAVGFIPGQYAALRFKRNGRPTPARCFSIVNRPNQEGVLQFAVKVEGKFTTALSELAVGAAVDVDGPFGEFVHDQQYDKNSVMLAGGIGITPIMSILADAVPQGGNGTFTLLYSVRDQQDVAYADELLALEKTNSNFRVVFFITGAGAPRFDASHAIPRRITPDVITKVARNDFVNTSFFVCGPASFIDSMRDILNEKGVSPLRINTEAFTQAKAVVEKPSLISLWQRFWVYGLAAASFVLVLGTIATTDVLANSSDEKPATPVAVPAVSTTSSERELDNDTATQTTTPVTTTPTVAEPTVTTPTPTRTYQQPVSAVS